MRKIAVFLAVFLLFFIGCKKQPPEPVRVAEKLRISCRHDYGIRRWEYEDEEKIHAVLQYLRRWESVGEPQTDPEELDMDLYRIDVVLSDGSREVYYQQGNGYFSKRCGRWQCLEDGQGEQLSQLLRRMPTDARPVRRGETPRPQPK